MPKTIEEELAEWAAELSRLPGNPLGDRSGRRLCGGYQTKTAPGGGALLVKGGKLKGWTRMTLAEVKQLFGAPSAPVQEAP